MLWRLCRPQDYAPAGLGPTHARQPSRSRVAMSGSIAPHAGQRAAANSPAPGTQVSSERKLPLPRRTSTSSTRHGKAVPDRERESVPGQMVGRRDFGKNGAFRGQAAASGSRRADHQPAAHQTIVAASMLLAVRNGPTLAHRVRDITENRFGWMISPF
jgi:hypothetical protein